MESLVIEYDSRDERHKSPFGAVQPGTTVRFRLDIRGASTDTSATLEISAAEQRIPILMKASGNFADRGSFMAEFTPDKAGLVWYWFSVKSAGREYFAGAADGDSGTSRTVLHHPRPFQLTVYDPQPMPSWAGEGIVYHVFVDRFHKSGNYVPRLRKGSLLHADWLDKPLYIRGCHDGSIRRWTFFGGNLDGVREKLPYLWEMGANAIYLSPIFESPSNHKYDTADYSRIDPGFGDEGSLRSLCEEAQVWGMKVILDGVFSHTGSDSIYFNKEGYYSSQGAYQSQDSPFSSWYKFKSFPEDYDSWWGFKTLPNVNELDAAYLDFLVEGQESIVRKWMRAGVCGWRLDVADELPDEFIKRLRRVVKQENPEALLIGEVWDDASNKVSYSVRREYLLGHELDSVTGYPVREAILSFVSGRIDSSGFRKAFTTLMENYPPEHFRCNLNIIGSHDVARALTLLGGAPDEGSLGQEAKESYSLPAEALNSGMKKMKLASLLQFMLPGTPMQYYGDEAGMQGYSDPYNRGPYPWGQEKKELVAWYKALGEARGAHKSARSGDFKVLCSEGRTFSFMRTCDRDVILVAVNACDTPAILKLDVSSLGQDSVVFQDLFFGPHVAHAINGRLELRLDPLSSASFTATLSSPSLFPKLAMERCAGVLMHVTSLPSRYGIGDFGPEAYAFADLLNNSGQKLWQVLPMNPPSLGNSPYMCFSAMAGNPLMISPDMLVKTGLLENSEVSRVPSFSEKSVDFEAVAKYKHGLFRMAFARFSPETGAFLEFREANRGWLGDYSLFMVLKGLYQGSPWQQWDESLKSMEPGQVSKIKSEHARECLYHEFLQYIYDKQWKALKAHVNGLGIKIIGDMAIYVSGDSSDVWANRDMFSLDKDGSPLLVSGVPPDSFSATGQLWGHPVYRWEKLASAGYGWWKMRMRKSFEDFDYTRIDHFRGFAGYYAVPGGQPTAEHGRWLEGPGLELFRAMADGRKDLPIIVEDLGVITPDVVDLREATGFPGMKVLQFMDDIPQGEGHPEQHWVAYTGTHDNETLLQRYRTMKGLTQHERPANDNEARYVESMLDSLYKSPYRWALAPLQDLLGLGAEGRMNTPATAEGNWGWRVEGSSMDESLVDRLKSLTKSGGR